MNEFTPHDGGQIAAPAGTWVDTLHRDGSVTLRRQVPRHVFAWKHLGTDCDIVGWRTTTPPPGAPVSAAPQQGEKT